MSSIDEITENDFHLRDAGVQLDLVKAIAKRTSTPIIVVLINGGAIDVEWMVNSDRVSAIVEAWYGVTASRSPFLLHLAPLHPSQGTPDKKVEPPSLMCCLVEPIRAAACQ